MRYVFILVPATVLAVLTGVVLTYTLVPSHEAETSVEQLVVRIENGRIRGRTDRSVHGKLFYAFQEIPYAQPPVGDLRFKAPVPSKRWDNILNTTQNTKICYQVNYELPNENEDCLYLNVYTPKISKNGPKLPVMFWIHGGGFIEGDGTYDYYGPNFFMDYNVIVVTINYRLGPFGFLSTQDSVVPGNNGLKDQQLALKWVHQNIEHFGGNPEKITIFGQSAGAASVSYQLLNKDSSKLLHGAIMESGSALCPWAYQRNARQYAFRTAYHLNWTESDASQDLIDFLKTVSADQLDNASFKVYSEQTYATAQILQGFFYAPVIEEESEHSFLTESMFETISEGRASRVPVIMGINSEEAISSTSTPSQVSATIRAFDRFTEWLVPSSMNLDSQEEKQTVGELIRQIYTGEDLLQNHPGKAIRYFSDTSFNRAVLKNVLLQSELSNIFFYKFSHIGNMGNVSGYLEDAEHIGHNADLGYFWRMQFEHRNNYDLSKFDHNDLLTQQRLLTMWTNFAHFLNPTPYANPLLQNIIWPKVSVQFPYLNIDTDLAIEYFPKKDTFLAWDNLFGTYAKKPLINY